MKKKIQKNQPIEDDLNEQNTWYVFCCATERYGWHLRDIKGKRSVDLACKGHIRKEFDRKYEPCLEHKKIPLTVYRDGALYYDNKSLDEIPRLLDINVPYSRILEVLKILKEIYK